jgi:hypothetical protein
MRAPEEKRTDNALSLTCCIQVVQQYQLGAMGEEDMCGDVDLARLHAKDPEFAVNPSVGASHSSRYVTSVYAGILQGATHEGLGCS